MADAFRPDRRSWLLMGAVALALSSASHAQDAPGGAATLEEVTVTGSRISRPNEESTSPIQTITVEQLTANADITLDMYLNTMPQVSPGGTSTSNNPPNSGQANIDLRGLGPNRNLVLIDGRRPMVSSALLTVDVNTIPAAMIDSIDVITGGAGAAYGADAVAGAVNIKLKRNFEGVDLRTSYSNALEPWDAKEYTGSLVIGGKFAEGRGHALFGYDRSYRESMTKAQRPFSAVATSTTGTPPQGVIRWGSGNPIPEAAVDALFQSKYGVSGAQVTAQSGLLGFNRDGTLWYGGVPGNATLQVQNFKDPIDVTVNSRFYPDFYSYNFDAPNLLVLPLDRDSFLFKTDYDVGRGVSFFAQAGWTQYRAATGLAPTPVPSVATKAPGENNQTQVGSSLIAPGQTLNGSVVVPVTNPFIPADLRTLLAARTGDDPVFVGGGAAEPWRFGFRPTVFGLRQSNFRNTVVQFLGGMRGPLPGAENWDWEVSYAQGRTTIENTQTGNLDTQKLTDVLANPASGGGACATWNPFGTNVVPSSCVNYLATAISSANEFKQEILQGFVRGELGRLPAGPVGVVLGAETRRFHYTFAFRGAPGPFSGFNVGDPDGGRNSFKDVFTEALLPVVRDLPFARAVDVNVGFRRSKAAFTDIINEVDSPGRSSNAWKAEVNWSVAEPLRLRASYQRSVREPNFAELFSSSGSFPQIYDPCSVSSQARNGGNAAAIRALCVATGVQSSIVDTYEATPGAQARTVTDGNVGLKAELGKTLTFGVVMRSPWESRWLERLQASVDFYDIKIDGPILALDTNVLIASCFNYYGTNPSYSPNYLYCQGLGRAGGAIQDVTDPRTASGAFAGSNGGVQKTRGIDVQLDWGFDLAWLGAGERWGAIQTSLALTHVDSFKQSESPDLPPIEYAGTVSYFGAGLGTSYPEWKGVFTAAWRAGDVGLGVRGRYVSAMINRTKRQFPGEANFGTTVPPDVPHATYWDVFASYRFLKAAEVRLGLNNAFNLQPRQYAPNVQSGTDPSTYDVVGRRAFMQLNVSF